MVLSGRRELRHRVDTPRPPVGGRIRCSRTGRPGTAAAASFGRSTPRCHEPGARRSRSRRARTVDSCRPAPPPTSSTRSPVTRPATPVRTRATSGHRRKPASSRECLPDHSEVDRSTRSLRSSRPSARRYSSKRSGSRSSGRPLDRAEQARRACTSSLLPGTDPAARGRRGRCGCVKILCRPCPLFLDEGPTLLERGRTDFLHAFTPSRIRADQRECLGRHTDSSTLVAHRKLGSHSACNVDTQGDQCPSAASRP